MTDWTFTFDRYVDVLTCLLDAGLEPRRYDDPIHEDTLLLRHDVDWSPRKALRIAELEADNGVRSTFFFLLTSPFYNPFNQQVREIINNVTEMGHDVGVHFSTHQYWTTAPPAEELTTRVEREIETLRAITDTTIDVVSFHNPPEWIIRERFDGFHNTYEPRFFDDIAYRADSNQRWREQPPFEGGIPAPLQILTHPVLWGERDAYATDRLREERDYLERRVANHLERTDKTWDGAFGVGVSDGSMTYDDRK